MTSVAVIEPPAPPPCPPPEREGTLRPAGAGARPRHCARGRRPRCRDAPGCHLSPLGPSHFCVAPLGQPPKAPLRPKRLVERYRGAQRLARGRRTGPRPLPGQFVREEQPAPLEGRGACPREPRVG